MLFLSCGILECHEANLRIPQSDASKVVIKIAEYIHNSDRGIFISQICPVSFQIHRTTHTTTCSKVFYNFFTLSTLYISMCPHFRMM